MAPTRVVDGSREVYHLRVELLDLLMGDKGIESIADQARAAGINRATLFRLRSKPKPPGKRYGASMRVARRLADACATTVETLFERVPV
jgi:DNA-binding XRE family transcriptional regulator